MIRPKWSAIFPLGVTDPVTLTDRHPAVFTNRMARFGVGALEPRNYQRRFGFELAMRHIVVRKCAVEGILTRDEGGGDVISPGGGIGVIETAEIARPVRVPTTLEIGHRVIAASLFTYPKHRRHDVCLPGITRRGARARSRGHENLRLDFQ